MRTKLSYTCTQLHSPASPAAEVDPINISFFPPASATDASSFVNSTSQKGNSSYELGCFGDKGQADQAPMQLPPFGMPQVERWYDSGPTTTVRHGRFVGQQGPALSLITTCVQVADFSVMRQLTFELYQELLSATVALDVPRFVRIWNYLPAINEGDGDNECYRQFCWGRAEALGDIALPAATCIGSHDRWLRISALCTGPTDAQNSLGIRHIENPRQLSAYHYPKEYGPRSPSFARATLVSPPQDVAAAALLLVSGTSSIVDHKTLHAGDIAMQTAETLRNIQALFQSIATDLSPPSNPNSMELTGPTPLALRYYLRHAGDLSRAKTSWTANAGHWPSPAWYKADICRSDLGMEIEGVFSV